MAKATLSFAFWWLNECSGKKTQHVCNLLIRIKVSPIKSVMYFYCLIEIVQHVTEQQQILIQLSGRRISSMNLTDVWASSHIEHSIWQSHFQLSGSVPPHIMGTLCHSWLKITDVAVMTLESHDEMYHLYLTYLNTNIKL